MSLPPELRQLVGSEARQATPLVVRLNIRSIVLVLRRGLVAQEGPEDSPTQGKQPVVLIENLSTLSMN